jgi:hypothetical protein
MPRKLFIVLLLVFAAPISADSALRPDSLIFNTTMPLVVGEVSKLPLYVTRRGDYYVEAIFERAEGAERPLSMPFDMNIQIDRLDKVLFERDVSPVLGRDRPAATMFWFTSDREIPLKKPLTVALRIDAVPAVADGETVRIQIKRKLNRGRIR